MKGKLFIGFLFFVLCHISIAQDKGEVQFLVEVDNGYFEIVIDDTLYLKKYKTQLPVGKHKAKVWSPGYVTSVVSFEIEKDQVTRKHVKMAISNERIQYESDYKDYRMKFHKSLTIPASFTLATSLTSTYLIMKAYDKKKKILSDINSYHLAATYKDVVFYKDRIHSYNEKYNRQRIAFYTTLGISGALLGTTIYTYLRFKKNNREPQLNSESPFKDRFSLQIAPTGFSLKFIWG
ncbi:MAG: hypothetical protein WDZ35_13295 [Crocinitomicaceae bacterium]